MAESKYTPFRSEPGAAPVRLIVRRVRPSPDSQLALFANYSYHAFITDREGDTLELTAPHAGLSMKRRGRFQRAADMTAIRDEIQEMILEAARFALEQTHGLMREEDRQAMLADFKGKIVQYAGRYPVLDLFNEFQAASDSAHSAAVAAAKRMRAGTGEQPWGGWEAAPITGIWVQAVKHAAEAARVSHFERARQRFDEGREGEATEELCKAITCSIAAIASRQGWPHQSNEDLGNAVTALAVGTWPREGEDIYRMLESASAQGQDLSSAFAAAVAQPNAVGDKLFYDPEKGYNEDALFFAERTIRLANELAEEPR